ncbi:hypothetical protein ACQZF5_05250 [Corynebacterium diphtheriae]
MRGKKTPQHPVILQAKRTIRSNRVYVALWVIVCLAAIATPFVAGIVFESWGVFIGAIWVMIFPAVCLGVAGVDEIRTSVRRIECSHKMIDGHQWKEYQREQQKLQQILKEEGLS